MKHAKTLAPPEVTQLMIDPFLARLKLYLRLFDDKGGRYLADGLTLAQAYQRHRAFIDELGAKLCESN